MCTPVGLVVSRFSGCEDPHEKTVTLTVDSERRLGGDERAPVGVAMVSFELGIDQVPEIGPGDGVVVILLPDTVIGTPYTVTPHPVGPASEPFHAFHFLFGVGEGEAEVGDVVLEDSLVEADTCPCVVQCHSFHL